jgi:prepilin-type processing-associated H-X9-DG protein/prepilin-type N-terminal cleavage/methylation domain-containing protein
MFLKSQNKNMKSEKGFVFTLIELLIVIAIIAILASMLMPALRSARSKAKMIGCQSNLKQAATATFEYVNDYNGWIPFGKHNIETEYSGYATPGSPAWYCLLAPYVNIPSREGTYFFYRLGQDSTVKIPRPTAFTCSEQSFEFPHDYPVSYAPGLRVAANAPLQNNQRRGKISMIRSHSKKAWLNECAFLPTSLTLPATQINEGHIIIGHDNNRFSFRHANRGNILFFDGHISTAVYDDVKSPSLGLAVNKGLFDTYDE